MSEERIQNFPLSPHSGPQLFMITGELVLVVTDHAHGVAEEVLPVLAILGGGFPSGTPGHERTIGEHAAHAHGDHDRAALREVLPHGLRIQPVMLCIGR